MNWQFLGLNSIQVFELLNNCPVSCNVACEAIGQIDWTFTTTLLNVQEELGSTSVGVFEEVTSSFISDFLTSQFPDDTFVLDPIVVTSQTEVANNGERKLRALQDTTTIEIEIIYELKGATINIDTTTSQENVDDVLQSTGFTQALQSSGDTTLATAVVKLPPSPSEIQEVVGNTGSGNPARGAVAGSIVSAAVIGAVVIGLMIFSRRRNKSQAFMPENNTVFENVPGNSVASPRSASMSPSFDIANSFGSKIVASMSPHSDGELNRSSQQSVATSVVSSESEEVEPHPFSGVVPPMIVIDNIESDTTDTERSKKVSHIVPGMQLRADSALVSAINDKTKPFNASVIADFISKKVVDTAPRHTMDTIQLNRGESFNVFSSDADEAEDTDYASSVDAREDEEVERITEGNSNNASSRDRNPNTESRSTTTSRYAAASVKPPTKRPWAMASRPPRVPSDGSNSRGSPRSNTDSPSMMNRDRSLTPPPTQSPKQQNSDNHGSPSKTSGEGTPGQSNAADDTNGAFRTRILDSLWTRVTQKRSLSDTSDGEKSSRNKKDTPARGRPTSQGSSSVGRSANPVQSSNTSSHANRTSGHGTARASSQTPSLNRSSSNGSNHGPSVGQVPSHVRSNSQGSHHVRTNSRTSSASSGGRSFSEEGVLETFEAPAKGKLGLLIEQQPFKGVVITKVKDYSPLLGQIMPGDRIVNVNGTRTDHLNLGEVLRIMSNASKTWNGLLRLTVLRPHNEEYIDPLRDPRFEHSFEGDARPVQDIMNEASYDFDRITSYSSTPPTEFFNDIRHPPT